MPKKAQDTVHNPSGLKEGIPHGDLLFNLAVHLTEHKKAADIMLYTHWHEEIELLYIVEGTMLLQIDTHSFAVSKGDVILIPPNVLHGAVCLNHSSCSFCAVVFHPGFINSALRDSIQQNYIEPFLLKTGHSFYFMESPSESVIPVTGCIHSIIKAYQAKAFGYELGIKSRLLQIICLFIESNPMEKSKPQKNDPTATIRMKKILSFMEENYQQGFTIADWAGSIGVSRGHFCRIFKNYFQKSPIDYLLHYRIGKAAELLLHSDLRIIEIALDTGFESAVYFGIVFKDIMKVTPSEYRKQNRR